MRQERFMGRASYYFGVVEPKKSIKNNLKFFLETSILPALVESMLLSINVCYELTMNRYESRIGY